MVGFVRLVGLLLAGLVVACGSDGPDYEPRLPAGCAWKIDGGRFEEATGYIACKNEVAQRYVDEFNGAPGSIDCNDLTDREAVAMLELDERDPYYLDADDDGEPCELQ